MTDECVEKFARYFFKHGIEGFKASECDYLIALARIGITVKPRPIEEAPKDETNVLGIKDGQIIGLVAWFKQWRYSRNHRKPTDGWVIQGGAIVEPTHFIPFFMTEYSSRRKP